MASICLLVLCGIPGAGKSTWVKKFCSYIHESENHTSFCRHKSAGLNENDLGDRADREGAGEGIGRGKGLETYRVVHIAYDDLIPEELEAELIHDAQNHSRETKGVRWKMYRRAIVRCVDDLVAELSGLNQAPGNMTCDSQAAADEKIKTPVDEEDINGGVRQDFRSEGNQRESPVVDDPSVPEVTKKLSQSPLRDDTSRQNSTSFRSQINNHSSTSPLSSFTEDTDVRARDTVADPEQLKPDHDDAECISGVDSMEAVPDFLRTIFDDVVRRQIKGEWSSMVCWILVIDDNMYYSSMRYEFYQLARKYATGFAQVYFPVELTTALQRNETRQRQVDELVIRDMLNRLERPCLEISWQKYTAVWISESWDQSCFDNVLRLVDEATSHPVMPVQENKAEAAESRSICLASLLHQADVALRRILGEHIATAKDVIQSKTERSHMAASSNFIRKQILDDLRSQTLLIPDEIESETSADLETAFHSYLKSVFHQRLKTFHSENLKSENRR